MLQPHLIIKNCILASRLLASQIPPLLLVACCYSLVSVLGGAIG